MSVWDYLSERFTEITIMRHLKYCNRSSELAIIVNNWACAYNELLLLKFRSSVVQKYNFIEHSVRIITVGVVKNDR